MALRVITPGVSATVQDLGRPGYREWGVGVGGAFDRFSAALANALLGNALDCAVVEVTLFGGVYEAERPLALGLAGAPLAASVVRQGCPARPLVIPQSLTLQPGEQLVLSGGASGARAYLAVKGGWRTPLLLGSRSREERLKAGDVLDAEPGWTAARRPAESFGEAPENAPLRVVDGPDLTLVRAPALKAWFQARFRVGPEASRMGLRLEGPPLAVDAPATRISAPVAPGAIQIAGGQAIVLGVACGTVGGYPHVAHVISADLDRVGQLRPGDTVGLERVDFAEAREFDRQQRQLRAERLLRLSTLACDDLASSGPVNDQDDRGDRPG